MSTMMVMRNIHLPHDVVFNILSRLPVKSLLRFRCVCKPWKVFISDPSFINMHLNHSINNNNHEHVMTTGASNYSIAINNKSLLPDEIVEIDDYPFKTTSTNDGFKILGSCNGLLLITIYKGIYCIWNPSTKEFKKLPIEFSNKRQSEISSEYGFGYDKIIKDYKVVRYATFYDRSSEVKVYTLGSDSWRRIQDIPDTLALAYRGAAGNFVNGVLHWVVVNKLITPTYYGVYDEEASYIILSFDIEDEKYGEIQQPDFIDTNKFYLQVEVLGGCLYIMCNFHRICSDIWVMKEYGVKESWTKLFTIPCSWSVRPIKFTKNGEVLFVKHHMYLVIYDPKDGSAKTLPVRGLNGWFETETYVESLVSLNSGTFVGQEHAAWKRTTWKNSEKGQLEKQKQLVKRGNST